jgi:hypothetical protein
MSIEKIFEYPSVPELGIRGSNKHNWVPADFAVVKLDQAVGAGVKHLEGLKTGTEKILIRAQKLISGGIILNGRTRGNVFQKPITGD